MPWLATLKAWGRMGNRSKTKAAASAVPTRASRLAHALIPYSGSYGVRGLWLTPTYNGLRNAAWAARNARVASHLNPLALKLVVKEAEALLRGGQSLADVLEAFAELLMRP